MPDVATQVPMRTHPREVKLSRSTMLRAFALCVAVFALVAMIHHVGLHAIVAALAHAQRWLPLLIALELVRLLAEMLATRSAYDPDGIVPLHRIARATLIASALSVVLPAGRLVGELSKARTLSADVGRLQSTAAVVLMQSVCLIDVGAMLCVGALVLLAQSLGALGFAILALGVLIGALGLALLGFARGRALGGMLARLMPKLAHMAEQAGALLRGPLVRFAPALGWLLVARVVTVVQMGLMVVASGGRASAIHALSIWSVQQLAVSVAELVPAQIGVTEGALAAVSSSFGMTQAMGVSVGLLGHALALFGAMLGLGMAMHRMASAARG